MDSTRSDAACSLADARRRTRVADRGAGAGVGVTTRLGSPDVRGGAARERGSTAGNSGCGGGLTFARPRAGWRSGEPGGRDPASMARSNITRTSSTRRPSEVLSDPVNHSIRSMVCTARYRRGGRTSAILTGMRMPRASPSPASARTQLLSTDVVDQRTRTQLADSSCVSISRSHSWPPRSLESHQTDQPRVSSTSTIR